MIRQMPRSRRGLGLRPVNSIKHVVDIQGGLVAGTKANQGLIEAKDAPVLANVAEVVTGATVSSIYLKVEVYATSTAALANFYMYVIKIPGNNLATVNGNVVGSSDIKKFVIHQEMVMLEKNTTGNPRTAFAGVIRIPRGYKRFGTDDTLVCVVFAPGVSVDFCIQCIYKEFR